MKWAQRCKMFALLRRSVLGVVHHVLKRNQKETKNFFYSLGENNSM